MSGVVTVPELLDGHTVLDLECLDRIYPLSELLRGSSLFSGRAMMGADMFAVHDRTGRAARSHILDRSAGGVGPADR